MFEDALALCRIVWILQMLKLLKHINIQIVFFSVDCYSPPIVLSVLASQYLKHFCVRFFVSYFTVCHVDILNI